MAVRLGSKQLWGLQQLAQPLREFYAAYRKSYDDVYSRRSNRHILKKYFWLRHYHNTAVKQHQLEEFKI